MAQLTVAVLYGGRSTEYEVSLQSGANIGALLEKNGYRVVPVHVDRENRWFITGKCGDTTGGTEVRPSMNGPFRLEEVAGGKGVPADAVFPALHGSYGEDGTMQGLLEMAGAAYVGCGVMASSIGMDKELSKTLAALCGLPVLPHISLHAGDKIDFPDLGCRCAAMGYPVFVKPATLGSSVGVTRVESPAGLEKAVLHAFRFDTRVMVEKGVDMAREIVCGVLGAGGGIRTSLCGEVRPKNAHKFYDYDAKYVDPEGIDFVIPADLPAEMSGAMRSLASSFFRGMGGSGLARIDYLLDRAGKEFYFCEINTIPGFTSHSLYPSLFAKTGIQPEAVVRELVEMAVERRRMRQGLSVVRS